MRPSSLAINLEDQAAALLGYAATIRKTGRPMEVKIEGHFAGFCGTKGLHQVTSLDLEHDAYALDRDAKKLRRIYQ